jgi:peptide deformylase
MSSLEIRLYPDPILKEKSQLVDQVNGEIKGFMDDLQQTMYQNRGVGLAAVQVGVLKRVIVVDVGAGLISLANPEIVRQRGRQYDPEGCLSLPGIFLDVKRAQEVAVRGLNRAGKEIFVEGSGLQARALQHEIDHLDGILILDRVSKKRLKGVRSKLKSLEEAKK